MTVDRDSVLQAIRELYAEEDRWLFAKDVAVRMGLKGSGPIAKVVRKELEEIAEEGKTFPVECQFCDTVYEFTPDDIKKLIKNA